MWPVSHDPGLVSLHPESCFTPTPTKPNLMTPMPNLHSGVGLLTPSCRPHMALTDVMLYHQGQHTDYSTPQPPSRQWIVIGQFVYINKDTHIEKNKKKNITGAGPKPPTGFPSCWTWQDWTLWCYGSSRCLFCWSLILIAQAAVKLATIFSQCSDNFNQINTFNEIHISYPITGCWC